MKSNTIEYFGNDVVERAIAYYFAQNGVTEEVRDRLMNMEEDDEDDFFQLVSDFVENHG